ESRMDEIMEHLVERPVDGHADRGARDALTWFVAGGAVAARMVVENSPDETLNQSGSVLGIATSKPDKDTPAVTDSGSNESSGDAARGRDSTDVDPLDPGSDVGLGDSYVLYFVGHGMQTYNGIAFSEGVDIAEHGSTLELSPPSTFARGARREALPMR